MSKKEMVIRKIDVDVLKEFLKMYTPDAEIIIHDDGIEIEHEGFSWLM
jgi:hypothetical protein